MNKIMKTLMLSCDKATLLVEKKIDVGLSLPERLQLRMHTAMCDGCTRYRKQSELLHELLGKHLPGSGHAPTHLAISSAFKAEIVARMKGV